MATLKGLLRTISTTRNFWTVLLLKNSKKKKKIVFRDGSAFWLTYSEYWKVRNAVIAHYCVEQLGDDLFRIGNAAFTLIGSSDMVRAVWESNEFYDWDYRGKVVLDIGGFQGESAVFFSSMGAKKVIVYEPVVNHHESIKRNMLLNHVNGDLHEQGVGSSDGIETIYYEATDLGFGHGSKGRHSMQIKIRNVASVIEESRADVAKFNCEGAEESLCNLPAEILRKIDFYIIMAHTKEISEAIIDKFRLSGFSLVKENKQRTFLCFKRKSC